MSDKWLRLTGRIIILVTLLALTAISALAQDDDDDGYLPGEVVVKLVQTGDLPAVAAAHDLDPTPLDQFGAQPIFRLRINNGVDPLDKAAALLTDTRVLYAEPNFTNQTPEGRKKSSWASGGGEDEFKEQWALAKIRLPEAHTVTRGGGVTVAVLDTGVDAAHPALAGRLVGGFDFVDLDGDPSEVGSHEQDLVYGHGTHVAGLIALAAPEAKIMPVRVLDQAGIGNIWVLAEALAFAVDPDGNPATNDGAQVINLSLGTTRPTQLLADIVEELSCSNGNDDDDGDEGDDDDDDGDRGDDDDDDDGNEGDDDDDGDRGDDDDDDGDEGDDDDDDGDRGDDDDDDDNNCYSANGRGVVFVIAAGNSGADSPEYPAAEGAAGSLAVAATTPDDRLADFSNRGDWVHIAAPGESILSSVPGGGYGVWSGTSMAAPLVTGQVALIRAAAPHLDAIQVTQRILNTAAPIDSPVPRRIDAAAALGLPRR